MCGFYIVFVVQPTQSRMYEVGYWLHSCCCPQETEEDTLIVEKILGHRIRKKDAEVESLNHCIFNTLPLCLCVCVCVCVCVSNIDSHVLGFFVWGIFDNAVLGLFGEY